MWKLLLTVYFAVTSGIVVEEHYPKHQQEETKYKFVYAVNDPLTHDVKNQWEERVGDKVKGSYRLVEADGTIRIVDYYADGHSGFQATVRREGKAFHHQPAANSIQTQKIDPIQIPQSVVPIQAVQQAQNLIPVQQPQPPLIPVRTPLLTLIPVQQQPEQNIPIPATPQLPYISAQPVQTLQNVQNGVRVAQSPSQRIYPVQTVQGNQNIVPVQNDISSTSFPRDYYGATFVQERNYGRGLGFL